MKFTLFTCFVHSPDVTAVLVFLRWGRNWRNIHHQRKRGAAKYLRYFLHPGERNGNFAQNITSCITAYADYNLIKIIKVTIYNPYRCCQLFITYYILEISLLLLNYFHNALQKKKVHTLSKYFPLKSLSR